MTEPVVAGLLLAVLSAAAAWWGAAIMRRLPEPDEAPEDKVRYADLGTRRGLAPGLALAGAALGGAVGARLGWSPDLLLWAVLVPVFVVLAFIDWCTRYLPTKIIAPTYVVLIGLLLLVSALPFGDGLEGLKRAAIGWALVGGLYLVMWLVYPRGIGYGDVRLSGIIGIGLGHLGLAEAVIGLYAGFLTGALGGSLLAAIGVVDRKRFAFGPFMVAGAFIAVLFGDPIAAALGY